MHVGAIQNGFLSEQLNTYNIALLHSWSGPKADFYWSKVLSNSETLPALPYHLVLAGEVTPLRSHWLVCLSVNQMFSDVFVFFRSHYLLRLNQWIKQIIKFQCFCSKCAGLLWRLGYRNSLNSLGPLSYWLIEHITIIGMVLWFLLQEGVLLQSKLHSPQQMLFLWAGGS